MMSVFFVFLSLFLFITAVVVAWVTSNLPAAGADDEQVKQVECEAFADGLAKIRQMQL
jgi:hypothetical protein